MRTLSQQEIQQLETQGCRAELWQSITVGEGFDVARVHHTRFAGHVAIGVFREEPPTRPVQVLSEVGNGNITLSRHLTGQAIEAMLRGEKPTERFAPAEGPITIESCSLIRDCYIGGGVQMDGAMKLEGCVIEDAWVGSGVIAEESFIVNGARVDNAARLRMSFVGEASVVTDGFTAESTLVFANSYLANGEACASICGPYAVSHHKSTLLIAGRYAFYNAGSGTNFSNHAYKQGPLHYGVLDSGCKTASGCHIIWPAHIGAFSVCMNKIVSHPDTQAFPFSYVIGDGQQTRLIPARVIGTAGLERDLKKWPERDNRFEKRTLVNFEALVGDLRGAIEAAIILLSQQEGDYQGRGFVILHKDMAEACRRYRLLLDAPSDPKAAAELHALVEADIAKENELLAFHS